MVWCVPFGRHPFPVCAEAGWREPDGRGREQGAPAQYPWRTGGRQPGVRTGGGTSKKGGSMQTVCLHAPSPLYNPRSHATLHTKGGRRQLVGAGTGREGKGRVLIAPHASVDAMFTLIFCYFLLSYKKD